MSLTRLMISPEVLKAHRVTWYVWAGGEKIRRTSNMRGSWGYDTVCSCGWESRTGGATRKSVEDEVFSHRLGAQAEAETVIYECPLCRVPAGTPCRSGSQELDYLHAERWNAAQEEGAS